MDPPLPMLRVHEGPTSFPVGLVKRCVYIASWFSKLSVHAGCQSSFARLLAENHNGALFRLQNIIMLFTFSTPICTDFSGLWVKCIGTTYKQPSLPCYSTGHNNHGSIITLSFGRYSSKNRLHIDEKSSILKFLDISASYC